MALVIGATNDDGVVPAVRAAVHDGGRRAPHPRAHHGKAVQLDPIKPTLTAPKSKRLKLKHDELLSTYAFDFNLRRYTMAVPVVADVAEMFKAVDGGAMAAGAYTRPLLSST